MDLADIKTEFDRIGLVIQAGIPMEAALAIILMELKRLKKKCGEIYECDDKRHL